MADFSSDCGNCDCCSGDCFSGDCCSGDCFSGDCCCADCFSGDCCGDCMCDLCCGACNPSTNCCVCVSCSRSSAKCCCRFVTALTAIAIATLVAMLVVTYAVVFPARVTVEDAYLSRLALTNGTTALAYDVSLTIAVRNRNFATGSVWRTAPLYTELRFQGQTFARASAHLESEEWGLFKARGKGVYRVTMASSSAGDSIGGAPAAVALVGDGVVTEFVRESVAGVFELELAVVCGEVMDEEHHHSGDSSVRVTCPLKLSLPTATATVAFTTVKCTS